MSKSSPIFLNAWNLICEAKFEDGHNRIFGSKVMGKKVLKMAVFRHFLQFFPNISKNMIDREKFIITIFVDNSILRNLEKIFVNWITESEVMVVKILVQLGCPSNFCK